MRRWVLGPVFFITFCLCFSALFWHPYFRVQTVHFSGTNFVDDQRLVQYIRERRSQSVVYLAWELVFKGGLMRYFPPVSSYRCEWGWPNYLSVAITEKEPWISCFVDGHSYLVSQDGTILNTTSSDFRVMDSDHMVIVKGVPLVYFQAGVLPDQILSYLQDLTRGMAQGLPEDMSFQIVLKGFELEGPRLYVDNLVLYYDDALPIYVGDLSDLQSRLSQLVVLLKTQEEKLDRLDYIDLRVLGKVILGYGS